MGKVYYKILGVLHSAGDNKLKKAYGDAEEKFEEIQYVWMGGQEGLFLHFTSRVDFEKGWEELKKKNAKIFEENPQNWVRETLHFFLPSDFWN